MSDPTDRPLLVGDLLGLLAGPETPPEKQSLLAALMDAPRYYLGPTGIPERAGGLFGALEYTDAGDMAEAAKASRELWRNPNLGNAGRYATAAAAMMMPAVSAKMVNDGVDVAGDLGRFWTDESGALPIRHPFMREVASKSHSPKVAAREGRNMGLDITQADVRAIRAAQMDRYARKQGIDPLEESRINRPFKTRSAIEARNAKMSEFDQKMKSRKEAEAARHAEVLRGIKKQKAAKKNLVTIAQMARRQGYSVRASKSKTGNISSYYIDAPGGTVRVSDHELPWTPKRETMAEAHGAPGFYGFHGREFIVDDETDIQQILSAIKGQNQ